MSDTSGGSGPESPPGWQSPGGSVPPVPTPGYVFTSPTSAAPAAAAPGYGAAPGVAPGWTPPPKPGLIPLRPLTLGTMLGAAFQVMRRNPRPTFGIAVLLNGGVSLLAIAVVGAVFALAFSRIDFASDTDIESVTAGAWGAIALSFLVPVVVGIIFTAVLQGIISLEVARGTVGEKLRLPGLWRLAKGRMGALVGWSFIIFGVGFGAVLVIAILVGLLVALGGAAGIVGGVVLGILAFLALAAAAIWIGTKISLVPSVLMLERLPLREAVARSWRLTNGSFWKTFGIQLLVNAILNFAAQIVTQPISLIIGLVSTLLFPNGDDTTGFFVTIGVGYLVLAVVTLVTTAITTVMQTSTVTLIYIDLRMRKEGLDLELMHFVEARQTGDASVVDPYLPPAYAETPPPAAPSVSPWS